MNWKDIKTTQDNTSFLYNGIFLMINKSRFTIIVKLI